jgi:hypothetical protein
MPPWRLVTMMMGSAVMLGTAHLEAAAPGQTVTAAVRGVVRDPSGAVIPGAVITLTALDTGLQRPSVASGSEGTFQIVAAARQLTADTRRRPDQRSRMSELTTLE